MHDFLVPLLECPACHGTLAWKVLKRRRERIEEAEASCTACGTAYPTREGIALFLTPDLPRNDLWEQVETGLGHYLREHPEVERWLLEPPLESLSPADQFFRALALEERGQYQEARGAAEAAGEGLYTAETRTCRQSQVEYLLQRLSATKDPIVDLASGRCGLVEELARRLARPIVASDFSPRVLRRDRRWLEAFGLYEQVSLLCFDARRTPFRDGAVATMTTYLGLPNIERPAGLLRELRRIVGGELLAITHFYPEQDWANAAAIRQHGLEPLLFRRSALALLAAAGFQVELENLQVGRALPTPHSTLIEGAGIDALPVTETDLEWYLLAAR